MATNAQAEAMAQRIATLESQLAEAKVEHTRAILHYTVKGYTAGENANSKAWRERAEAAEAQCAALQAAALAFVNQLDHVLASPDYQSVLAMGWIHGAKEYRGPNWKAEYDILRALLTAPPSSPSQP